MESQIITPVMDRLNHYGQVRALVFGNHTACYVCPSLVCHVLCYSGPTCRTSGGRAVPAQEPMQADFFRHQADIWQAVAG